MTPPATHYARCPGCQTVFRVSEAQLALREGQVRCGNCRAVFDANRERVAQEAEAIAEVPDPVEPADIVEEPAAENALDDAATETADPVEAVPLVETAPPLEAAAPIEAAPPAETAPQAESVESPIRIDESGLRSERFQWQPRKPLRERPQALYTAAIVVLLVALAAQALFEYPDSMAARAPFMRPLLESVCAVFGCSVEPLRDAGALSIDASDLRGDPAHRGFLKLSATIRNRASYPIAWPYLELTLTDSSDRVVARRAFPPDEYAASATRARGLPPNGEEVVTLFLDASATSQSGYRLYLFYP